METGTFRVKSGLAEMLKGGVITSSCPSSWKKEARRKLTVT